MSCSKFSMSGLKPIKSERRTLVSFSSTFPGFLPSHILDEEIYDIGYAQVMMKEKVSIILANSHPFHSIVQE